MDLSPAKWIWLPSQRTLSSTFVLFRREVELAEQPGKAVGWILADSRYRLTANGQRVQWGPAPHDPRHAEADPVDLMPYLREGKNCIGIEVLYYGHGDGTWPFGKPGLLMRLEIDGQPLVTDASWQCIVDRAHPPGQYARWFLRALQEEFDARLHPYGWDEPGFDATGWLPAKELQNPPNRAAFAGGYTDYTREVWMTDPASATLIERTIPMLREEWIPAKPRFLNSIAWHRDPRDWFEFRVPNSFTVAPTQKLSETPMQEIPATEQAYALTYELSEEVVGWPGFTIDAPAGTVVEVMIQESHDHEKTPWLDSHIYAWSRFICKEGVNRFRTFDFEAGRWLQLHVHGNSRPVTISDVGILRRIFPWPNRPEIEIGEPALQRLFDASINTLNNSAQETIVDGMGRERQQYAGDGSHQLHAIRYAFGETRLPARYLRTFAEGQLLDGVFADSWPAVDRLQRIWERNVGASDWGPLIDHSVGFVFDHYHHWMQSGDLEPVKQNWPRIIRFVNYLVRLAGAGLLPVEDVGVNAVWIDHQAFQSQSSKRCAFNLYVVAMLQAAFLPLVAAIEGRPDEEDRDVVDDFLKDKLKGPFTTLGVVASIIDSYEDKVGDESLGYKRYQGFAETLLSGVQGTHWDAHRRLFVHGVPGRLADFRTDDRSLATAVLYGLCPDGQIDACVEALATRPPHMGQSYPANMVWNYWALAKAGRIQPVIDDLRERWAPMRSVVEANALQEFWTTTPDTTNLMSHCPLAPLTALYQGVMGLWPAQPGFTEISLRPQLGDIQNLYLVAHTPQGPVTLKANPYEVELTVPAPATVHLSDRQVRLAAGRPYSYERSQVV